MDETPPRRIFWPPLLFSNKAGVKIVLLIPSNSSGPKIRKICLLKSNSNIFFQIRRICSKSEITRSTTTVTQRIFATRKSCSGMVTTKTRTRALTTKTEVVRWKYIAFLLCYFIWFHSCFSRIEQKNFLIKLKKSIDEPHLRVS